MKTFFKAFSVFLILTVLSGLNGFQTSASFNPNESVGNSTVESDIYNSDFAENHVIVVMEKKKSLEFLTFSPEDFEGINCKSVVELTPGMKQKAMNMIKEGVDESEIKYNQILLLELSVADKESVISSINKLKTMEGVLSAEPDYYGTPCSTTPRNNQNLQIVHLDEHSSVVVSNNNAFTDNAITLSVDAVLEDAVRQYADRDVLFAVNATCEDYTKGRNGKDESESLADQKMIDFLKEYVPNAEITEYSYTDTIGDEHTRKRVCFLATGEQIEKFRTEFLFEDSEYTMIISFSLSSERFDGVEDAKIINYTPKSII